METVIDISSEQEDLSEPPTQHNTGNNTCPQVQVDISDGLNSPNQQQGSYQSPNRNEMTVSVPMLTLLEMTSKCLGVLVCGWAVVVLVQGGIVFTLHTEDRVFVTVMFLFVWIRYWSYFLPQATSQSLSTNNIQQLELPIRFVSRLFYWYKLLSAMTCVVLSCMRLFKQDFGPTQEANKATRDFALNVFYLVSIAEAMVLFAWCYLLRR